jgi:hypothetical protein
MALMLASLRQPHARAGWDARRTAPLLEDGVHLTEELGVKAYLASWTVNLADGLLAAGQAERARQTAQRPPGNQAQRPDRVSKGVPASASARRHPPLYFGWGTILI